MDGASANGIFRKSAMNSITNADDLDHYIRVTNPSAWVVLIAALLISLGLIVWSATAVIPTTVGVTGVVEDGYIVCWVSGDVAQKMEKGAQAKVGDEVLKVSAIGQVPLSKAEIKNSIGSDYLAESVELGDWSYTVTLEANDTLKAAYDMGKTVVPVSITVSEDNPISLVLGR